MTSEGMSLRKRLEEELERVWRSGFHAGEHHTHYNFPPIAHALDQALHLVAEEVERMPKAENPHEVKTDPRHYGDARVYDDGQEDERANIVALLRKEDG